MSASSATPGAPAPRRGRLRTAGVALGVLALIVGLAVALDWYVRHTRYPNPFVGLRDTDLEVADAAVRQIGERWDAESAPMTLSVIPLVMHGGHRERLFDLLRAKTGQPFGNDLEAWHRWQAGQPAPDTRKLLRMRYEFYSTWVFPLGPMADFLAGDPPAAVRGDEIRPAVAMRDTPPPVTDPRFVAAGAARFLTDADQVFGLRIGADARAYPHRLVAGHTVLEDTVGGVPVVCVLTAANKGMAVYDRRGPDGTPYQFGTSGFAYHGNALLYDRGTLSLWAAEEGRPVVGKLVGTNVKLTPHPVIVTTWGDWRAAHPDTKVLSPEGLEDDSD
jgi:hypothetical protein